ncbi:hypothetical protein PILCRDRAFT_15581 [Piloderma croceum F 1598]|uniref:Uncharacterized protein n=1 Tax=Piloderma croceum (strain F 1598) TaxID=765440 RepID=A0A0C3B6S1_PILCF|nr:hypothetical protein PILCRDRAFT_15581 [Piloderma croceum F 1598]
MTPYIKGPIQHLLIETFDISAHLTHRERISDLHVVYAKYLAIQDVAKKLSQMEVVATWTHKKPILEDIIQVFMSKSGYFNCPQKLFPKVSVIPNMQEWLENGEDALADADVWGDKKSSYKSLQEILALHNSSGGKKGKRGHKGKKKQNVPASIHSSEEVVNGKGKGERQSKDGRGW